MTNDIPKIPFVDLKAQYQTIAEQVPTAIERVLTRTDFILGQDVTAFESEFAKFCGAAYGVGCASGTDALHLACRALNIGSGDEVIVPAFTFVATALGVSLSGARPVLVDVEPDTALLDISKVETAISNKTKAIMPVHLYGQCVDMDSLNDIAKRHHLYVIEDAAQAHGAHYREKRAGALADIGCFSFYPSKNLGAYGDGGFVTTSDAKINERLRLLRNWGARKKYDHDEFGVNSRLDTIQAAILRVKLPHLDQWNQARAKLAAEYANKLAENPQIQLTRTREGSVFHLYVVRVANRDAVLQILQAKGVGAGIHYPFAMHEHKAYEQLGYVAGDFPVAEDWARRCLTLPMYPEMPCDFARHAAQLLLNTVS